MANERYKIGLLWPFRTQLQPYRQLTPILSTEQVARVSMVMATKRVLRSLLLPLPIVEICSLNSIQTRATPLTPPLTPTNLLFNGPKLLPNTSTNETPTKSRPANTPSKSKPNPYITYKPTRISIPRPTWYPVSKVVSISVQVSRATPSPIPTPRRTNPQGSLSLDPYDIRCTGSIVLEPNDTSRGMIRCPFAKLTGPPVEQPTSGGTDATFTAVCIALVARRHVVIKANNVIGAYQTVSAPCRFQFTFLHSSPTAFLSLCNPLYTIATSSKTPGASLGGHAATQLQTLLQPILERPFDTQNFVHVREQAVTPNIRCSIVTPLQSQPGTLVLTSERIYVQRNTGRAVCMSWLQKNAVATARRYNGLRDAGLEIYWKGGQGNSDATSTLLAFERRHDRELVLHNLPSHVPCVTDREFVVQCVSDWHHGQLSNFEYLLALNSAAGRSFHDLSRYPVFPWVIADYTSTKLDFQKPSTFRDLTRPMGALNPTRLEYFQSRLQSMRETSMDEAFLYGTHYSAPGYVLYFLIRSMPEHMLCLQNGKFDAPDRMFHSVAQCYSCALTNHADVKELTPEFYSPHGNFDFLINVQGLQLGATQNGERVNDVQLPPWARSPRDFIKKNIKALESAYCTQQLPRWIDLIFGYSSRGEACMEASNVFHPNAYLGPTDIASMQTEEERFQAELQATEFGIVPDKVCFGSCCVG